MTVVSRACREPSVHSLPGVADLAVEVVGDGWRARARGVPAGDALERRGVARGAAEALRLPVVFSGDGVSSNRAGPSSSLLITFKLE